MNTRDQINNVDSIRSTQGERFCDRAHTKLAHRGLQDDMKEIP